MLGSQGVSVILRDTPIVGLGDASVGCKQHDACPDPVFSPRPQVLRSADRQPAATRRGFGHGSTQKGWWADVSYPTGTGETRLDTMPRRARQRRCAALVHAAQSQHRADPCGASTGTFWPPGGMRHAAGAMVTLPLGSRLILSGHAKRAEVGVTRRPPPEVATSPSPGPSSWSDRYGCRSATGNDDQARRVRWGAEVCLETYRSTSSRTRLASARCVAASWALRRPCCWERSGHLSRVLTTGVRTALLLRSV